MRKVLIFFAALWCTLSLAFANNNPTKLYYKTYSVEAEPYTTEYMTFEPYHAILDLDNLLRVSEKGDFQVILEYLKGMEVGTEEISSSFAGSYYSIPVTSPVYKVNVFDKNNNLVHEKQYGGNNALVEFGKNQQQDDIQIASTWAAQKEVFLQATEFQQLNFQNLEADLKELVSTLEAAAPSLEQEAEPVIEELTIFEESPIVEDVFADIEDTSNDVFANKPSENFIKEETSPIKALTSDKRNIVKLNLPNLFYKNITLNYERILSNRTSASIHAGYIIPGAPPSFLTDGILGINTTTAPTVIDPTMMNPTTIDPTMMNPTTTDPTMMNPTTTDPTMMDPTTADPTMMDPTTADPTMMDPTTTDPTMMNPTTTDPTMMNPTTTDPTTMNPTTTTPTMNVSEFSGFTATGEYRIYGKKKGAPRGLYYAPYLRYASYKYLFDDTIDGNFANIDARATTFGLGAQLGYQWVIKDRFVIDWGILGAAVQRYNLSSTFTSTDDMVNFQEIQKELETQLASNNILRGTIEFNSGDSFLNAKLPFLFGGLRSYISIGMQF